MSSEDSKKNFASTFRKHTQNISIYGGFLTLSLCVYFFLSSGDFSFLLTYASFMRCFGFGLLNFKMWTSQTAKGVSVKSLQLYVFVFVARLASILRHQGYLPFDKTGDWFYHAVEIVSLLSVCVATFGVFFPLSKTYEEKYDKFGNLHIPNSAGALYLIIPCALLALFVHPHLNREYLADVCWTFSMYLESCAMLPQIYMFQKQSTDEKGIVEVLIGHTVFMLGFARLFELFFWIGSFKELADASGSASPGYVVLLSQIIHLIIMGDFFYYYFMSLSKGVPMELPQQGPSYNNLV